MRRMPYVTVLVVMVMIVVTSPFVFFNGWILRHDVPTWLRTIVYFVNPPEELRSSIVVAEVVSGVVDVSYTNEYFGKYAIYLANDALGRVYVKLDSEIRYDLSCDGEVEHSVSGVVRTLPEAIWFYTTPADVPVGGRVDCTVRVDPPKGEKLYVVVNKLFDV